MRIRAIVAIGIASVVACSAPAPTTVVSTATATAVLTTPAQQPSVMPSSPATTCGPVQDQTTSATCLLLPGTLVEIVGYDGRLSVPTPLVRVRLESPMLSAQYGNPVLLEADARTQIEPPAPTIAATGVNVGARVQVAFDGHARGPSGAYLLTRFVAVSSPSARPVGFVLPAGCSFVGSPVLGNDYSQWQFDCGATANRDARGTLAPAFTQQGWTSCGVGLGSATWMNGAMRLVVSEGSGVPGPSGLPTLTQPARAIQTACG
jgi:hypothetical protein